MSVLNLDKPLEYEVTHVYDGVNISKKELNRLLDIACWNKCKPNFKAPGRVAWEPLEEEVSLVDNPAYKFIAAKLKGVGLFNPPSDKKFSGIISKDYSVEPSYPTTTTWDDLITYPHFGIADDGSYKFAYSHPSPVGGILHERAIVEYNVAKNMLEAGIPTIIPLAVIKYNDDFTFNGKPMGAVITLSVSASHLRASQALYSTAILRGTDQESDAYYDDMLATLGVDGDPTDEVTRLQVVNKIAGRLGKLIHQFSMKGFYRYSSEWSNFQYSAETDELLFIDLDSSRSMEADNLPQFRRSLEAIRDLATVVYRSTAKMAYPTIIDKYTLNNVLKFNPILQILTNYFPEAAVEELEVVSKRLYNSFIPHWFQLKRYKKEIGNVEWDRERRKTYKMEHDLFYILIMTSLFPFFRESDIGQKYGDCPSDELLMQRAKDYLGDRYEYFVYLMNGGKL